LPVSENKGSGGARFVMNTSKLEAKQRSIDMDNITLLITILFLGAVVFVGVFTLIASLMFALDN
jgi:hypothetical protein